MAFGVGREGKIVHTCRDCSEELPPGRSYCREHYEQALAEYEASLADYERELAEWRSMSDEERAEANDEAESESVLGFAALCGAILGGGGWWYLYATRKIDVLYGLMLVVGVVAIVVVVPPLRYAAGKLTRTTAFALLYAAVLLAVVWLLSKISGVVSDNLKWFCIGAASVGTIAAAVRELLGGNSVTGEPIKPTPPPA